MCVQRETGCELFIWLCGRVDLASARGACSVFFFFFLHLPSEASSDNFIVHFFPRFYSRPGVSTFRIFIFFIHHHIQCIFFLFHAQTLEGNVGRHPEKASARRETTGCDRLQSYCHVPTVIGCLLVQRTAGATRRHVRFTLNLRSLHLIRS